jgi:hypothetical protein
MLYLILKSRGITKNDIEKYNIGYCETGRYAKMIIIPSYDENGQLNYFTGRSFEKNLTPNTAIPKLHVI